MRKFSPKQYAHAYLSAYRNVGTAAERDAVTERFVSLLHSSRMMSKSARILLALEQLIDEQDQTATAHTVVARELSAHAKSSLAAHLEGFTGKRVDVRATVDQRVLGGARVRIGDVQIDGTVEGTLKRLQKSFS